MTLRTMLLPSEWAENHFSKAFPNERDDPVKMRLETINIVTSS